MNRNQGSTMSNINITLYRWAGSWGPFKIKVPCGECTLTEDVIRDTLDNELAGIEVNLEEREWLSEWWKPLLKGGWHAPIVMVNGRIVSQGEVLNRGLLTQFVTQEKVLLQKLKGNHVFGKASCPYCSIAGKNLDAAGIEYTYHDVVRDPQAMYEMISRVKPIVGPTTPITVPQIWIDGEYIGGSDALSAQMDRVISLNQAA